MVLSMRTSAMEKHHILQVTVSLREATDDDNVTPKGTQILRLIMNGIIAGGLSDQLDFNDPGDILSKPRAIVQSAREPRIKLAA